MPFPVVTPSFFKELVDVTKPAEEYNSFTDVIVSPAAVEYILHLSNPEVVRKLMELPDPIAFKMAYVGEEEEEMFVKQSQAVIDDYPAAAYYWQIRSLMMGVLQDRGVTFEKRMLILNFAIKSIQGMIDKHQPNLIPQFANDIIKMGEYEKILEYFKNIKPNFAYSLADGVSLLKSLTKSTPAYKEIMARIYKNLGVTGPETLSLVNMKDYITLRRDYTVDFMANHSAWMENIMVNYVWSYSVPYAASSRLSIWENYVFFSSVYNAVKILITCFKPADEDEFVKVISAFDDALRKTGNDIVWKIVAAIKNAGQANNGDMAVLVIS